MSKKSGSKMWLIPLCIGIIFEVVGLVLFISGFTKSDMGAGSLFYAIGAVLFFIGLVTSTEGTILVYHSSPENNAKRIARQHQKTQRFYDALKEQGIDPSTVEDVDNEYGLRNFVPKQKPAAKKVCQYCGTENSAEATKCKSCRAKL